MTLRQGRASHLRISYSLARLTDLILVECEDLER